MTPQRRYRPILVIALATTLVCVGCGDDDGGSNCPAGEFSCGDSQCVPDGVVCDGTPDCSNTADEHASVCCDPTDFVCDTLSECLPAAQACDGNPDCADGSDELARHCCDEYDFVCDNGWQCIDPSLVCDTVFDCDDISDEFISLCGDPP